LIAALVIAAVLSQEPSDAPKHTARPKVSFTLSVGSFIGSVWAAQSYRDTIDRFRTEAADDLLVNHGSVFDSHYLMYATPVLGPWMTLARGGQQARDDMWMLVTSGVLQGIGLSVLTYRLFNLPHAASEKHEEGLELSFAPYVSGRLGVAVTLTGF
jgi:hypothetical protein